MSRYEETSATGMSLSSCSFWWLCIFLQATKLGTLLEAKTQTYGVLFHFS